MATSVLLLNGYIRQIEELLLTQIIPESITTLCYQFYYASNLLFYLLHKESSFCIADIGSQSQWKCNVYPLNLCQGNFPHSQNNPKQIQLQINEGGLFYAHDIKLPKQLSKIIHRAYFDLLKDTAIQPMNDQDDILSNSDQFDIIFQCGGLNTTQCNAIIFDNNLIQPSSSESGMFYERFYMKQKNMYKFCRKENNERCTDNKLLCIYYKLNRTHSV